MANIQTYKPPKLALLEQKQKVIDYPNAERTIKTRMTVALLLSLLGVSPGKEVQWKSLENFINDVYKLSTYEEIDEAFKMYVSGKFNLKPYQQLNAVVFGQVMREFEFYKKENLREYRRKLKSQKIAKQNYLSEEDKENIMLEAVDRIKRDYKFNGKITEECSHVYDYLHSKGALQKHDKRFRNRIHKKAVKVAKNEFEELSKDDYTIREDLKNILREIGKSDRIIPIKKRLVLEEYFKTPEQLLNKL